MFVQTLEMVVGYQFERRLATRAQQMLVQANAAPSPYTIGVRTDDSLGIAAARVLCAAEFLTQDTDEDTGAEVYGFFCITEEGKRAIRQKPSCHS